MNPIKPLKPAKPVKAREVAQVPNAGLGAVLVAMDLSICFALLGFAFAFAFFFFFLSPLFVDLTAPWTSQNHAMPCPWTSTSPPGLWFSHRYHGPACLFLRS